MTADYFPVRFWVRWAAGILVAFPLIFLYGLVQDNTDRARVADERAARAQQIAANAHADAVAVAQERIDRTLAACRAFNDQRVAQIATSEALIRTAAGASPTPLSPREQLLLDAWVVKANQQIAHATKPRTCTVAALGLQSLEAIASSPAPATSATVVPGATLPGPPVSSAEREPPTTMSPVMPMPPTTVSRPPPSGPPPPPATACRTHGRCHPKG